MVVVFKRQQSVTPLLGVVNGFSLFAQARVQNPAAPADTVQAGFLEFS